MSFCGLVFVVLYYLQLNLTEFDSIILVCFLAIIANSSWHFCGEGSLWTLNGPWACLLNFCQPFLFSSLGWSGDPLNSHRGINDTSPMTKSVLQKNDQSSYPWLVLFKFNSKNCPVFPITSIFPICHVFWSATCPGIKTIMKTKSGESNSS